MRTWLAFLPYWQARKEAIVQQEHHSMNKAQEADFSPWKMGPTYKFYPIKNFTHQETDMKEKHMISCPRERERERYTDD